MKYVIIQPYFGKFPKWIDLFLFSCGKNKRVDFVFFTDCNLTCSQQSYSNVKFIKITYEEYCKLVSERLNIDFHPTHSYKLCDLKPFLGVVHYDIISQYDCWGYCDIDLVFGDLDVLLKKMEKYDFISTHDDRSSGHFTLMKTQSKYTKICFTFKNWKKKLLMQKNKCLDERDLTIAASWIRFYRDPVFYRLLKPWCAFIKPTYYRILNVLISIFQSKKVSFEEYYTTPIPNNESKYVYNTSTGKLINALNNQELPYLHFLFFKKTQYLENKDYWKGNYYQIENENVPEFLLIEINKIGISYIRV